MESNDSPEILDRGRHHTSPASLQGETFLHCKVRQVDYEYITLFFYLRTYIREITDIFPHLKITLILAFSQTPLKKDLSNFA